MKRLLLVSGILVGAVAYRVLSAKSRQPNLSFAAKMRERMKSHMSRMMQEMPENSPPRLVMSTLPRLAEQNEQILALLREQNALIRQFGGKPEPV